mmetsp:Transcript_33305/g.66284  ORF Transcript_33305/g.66284 Transcript_33305/m.66284 type:complete len:83 (+) Transcript_33305:629-877(+)
MVWLCTLASLLEMAGHGHVGAQHAEPAMLTLYEQLAEELPPCLQASIAADRVGRLGHYQLWQQSPDEVRGMVVARHQELHRS